MLLKNLIVQTKWDEVAEKLISFFPEAIESFEDYQSAFAELQTLKPDYKKIRLLIGRNNPDGTMPYYVLGFPDPSLKGRCLKFTSWPIWLGVDAESMMTHFHPAAIIAICLYDMTWCGFSSDSVTEFREEFISNQDYITAVYDLVEETEASISNPVKKIQRANEILEAIGLHDFDINDSIFEPESRAQRDARLVMEEKIYILGETETDLSQYTAKVTELRDSFRRNRNSL